MYLCRIFIASIVGFMRVYPLGSFSASDSAFDRDPFLTSMIRQGNMPLSKLTAASLADRGYIVNMAMVS